MSHISSSFMATTTAKTWQTTKMRTAKADFDCLSSLFMASPTLSLTADSLLAQRTSPGPTDGTIGSLRHGFVVPYPQQSGRREISTALSGIGNARAFGNARFGTVSGEKRFDAAAGGAGDFVRERRKHEHQLECNYQRLHVQLNLTFAQARLADVTGGDKIEQELLLQAKRPRASHGRSA